MEDRILAGRTDVPWSAVQEGQPAAPAAPTPTMTAITSATARPTRRDEPPRRLAHRLDEVAALDGLEARRQSPGDLDVAVDDDEDDDGEDDPG